tara:strand:- start:47 stop:595 length:549 start_codon:yes stop_codon:yes gene_type:complete
MEKRTPWYPCWGIKINLEDFSISNFVKKFLEIRPNNRWLLISKDAAASERHLWHVWFAMEQQYLLKSALSKNVDAEFIRIISGTNQLKTAFSRAGLNETDTEAWLIYLPIAETNLELLPEIPIVEFTEEAQKITYIMNSSIITERPKPTKNGLERLGIKYEGNEGSINEELFISHIARSSFS